MSKVNLTVTFETITPLWTGDAWMENSVIRPSSLMGSLRFWFEVICYFGGVCKKEEFDKDKGRFEKDIENEKIKKKFLEFGTNFDGQVQALRSLNIPIPAIVFGTTGWKSLIEIKEIIFNDENFNEVENTKIFNAKNWYWKSPEYNGIFNVIFEVEENIKDSIFLPLLTFMDNYGYWGGGWNIGYGRLRVVNVNGKNNEWKKEEFDFSSADLGKKKFSDIILQTTDIKSLKNKKETKIQYSNQECQQNDLKQIIMDLIWEKVNLRVSETNKKDRHYIFGKTGNIQGEVLPQGSKILPYVNKLDNGSYQCGLLSIAGILSLYEQGEKNE